MKDLHSRAKSLKESHVWDGEMSNCCCTYECFKFKAIREEVPMAVSFQKRSVKVVLSSTYYINFLTSMSAAGSESYLLIPSGSRSQANRRKEREKAPGVESI